MGVFLSCHADSSSGSGGLGTGVIIALAVSITTVVGLVVFCICLVRIGRYGLPDACKPYSVAKPRANGDASTVASNAANLDLPTLQDMTFGRMSPEWSLSASRHQSAYLADDDPDANIPIPPLNYKEIIESGWYEKWLLEKDFSDSERAEYRNSVLSLSGARRLDAGRFMLHANTVAIGLSSEEDGRTSSNEAGISDPLSTSV